MQRIDARALDRVDEIAVHVVLAHRADAFLVGADVERAVAVGLGGLDVVVLRRRVAHGADVGLAALHREGDRGQDRDEHEARRQEDGSPKPERV
jgi:hypothetical protein